MQYTIKTSELKTTPYGEVRDITATDLTGNEISGAVWSKAKDGTLYPNFAGLVAGAIFEANAWTNPTTGKVSFFAPKPSTGASGGNKGAMAGAMKAKQEGIAKSQDRKEEGIKTSSTIRLATDIVTARMAQGTEVWSIDKITEEIESWRTFFVTNWDLKE
jgi:hypothetical protein